MNSRRHRIGPAILYQRALILRYSGELIIETVPVEFFSRQVLGALIVLHDAGLVHHELMLIKERLKAIADPSFLLGREAFGINDRDRIADLLEDRLKRRVEYAVAKVGLDDDGVYFIVLGDPCPSRQQRFGITAPKSPALLEEEIA